MRSIEMLASFSEFISFRRFLGMSDEERAAVRVDIEPVTVGRKGFGGVRIYRKAPVYKARRRRMVSAG